ncbi:MAG: hypothetical protein GYA24_10575 [Candidatus Lokiarchaeota archaeon]|nr:hypothetical protein [Candidatus Lokiarchaeota archaeon]
MTIPSSSLPFPIGNETELQIVNERGEILRGEELLKVWNAIFDKVEPMFKQTLDSAPDFIRKRIGAYKRVTKEKSGKQLPYLEVEYKTFKTFHISVIGPDPNISQVTWLMELVTPPASSMEEFAWWNVILNTVLVKCLPPGYWILPLGLSPTEKEYASGVTFGEHYHVGVDDANLKLAIYNIIRDFIPHLIALTTNSPFINKKPTGIVKISTEGGAFQVLGKDCTKSLRLFYNKAQMGPIDKDTYIPCLKELDKAAFCDVVHRKPPDDRFVDVYPFTPYGTIELRVFDTQFSLSRRIAIVALIAALCLKAKRLVEKNERIPCVLSSVLVANREKAVVFGLHGKFTPDTTLPGSFAMIYNEDPVTGKQNGKLFQAVKSLLFFLKGEIADLGVKDVLSPVLLSIDGNERLKAPMNPSDYLLHLVGLQGGSVDAILPRLKNLQLTYCTGNGIDLGDPLVHEYGVPTSEHVITSRPAMHSAITTPEPPASIEFTGVQVTATEPQIKVVKPVAFTLTFTAESPAILADVNILLIQQLIEIQKKSEIVLATSFKRLAIPVNKAVTLTQDDFPLVPSQDLFIGNKQCRLKFVIKEQREVTAYSNAFWIELLPRYTVTSDFRKKKLVPGEKVEIKYKIAAPGNNGSHPPVDLDFKFQVVSADGTTVLHQATKPIPVREAEVFSFTMTPLVTWKEREVSIRLTTFLNDKIVARHEIVEITIDLPEEKMDTFTLRLADRKGDGWPRAKELIPASPATPAASTKAPVLATRVDPAIAPPAGKYGVIKHLEFASKPGGIEPSPVHVKTSNTTTTTNHATRAGINIKPVKVVQQASRPLQAKPGPGMKSERDSRGVTKPLATRLAPKPASTTASNHVARASQEPAPPVQDGKAGQSRMASLLQQDVTRKEPAGEHADATQLPFIERLSDASKRVEIVPRLLSPRLVAPGEKISIEYTMRKIAIIGENDALKLISFFINARHEFIVVLTEKYRFQGEFTSFTLTVDPAKHFKDWKPTEPFYAVMQAYLGNTLVGQAVFDDFELARFTTSSQIAWRKIDVLSGTLYAGMDAGFELELQVKSIVNPVAMTIEGSCQGTVVTSELVVGLEGTRKVMAPFRVPFQGLTTVPSTPMIIKIKDSSGMTIKEQKKVVSIIARGPMFVIKGVVLDMMEGLDIATLAFDIFNDSKQPVACEVIALAIALDGNSTELATRKVKLKGTELQHVECTKVRIPVNMIRDNELIIDFLIEIPDFNKIKSLIRHRVKADPVPGEVVGAYFHGKLKNLERTRDITSYIDKVGIEIDVRKDVAMGGCKARIVEILDGDGSKMIHVVKLPRGRDRVHETIYWKPPKVKNFPSLCKIDVQFVQDDELIKSERMHIEPLFFTIFPD